MTKKPTKDTQFTEEKYNALIADFVAFAEKYHDTWTPSVFMAVLTHIMMDYSMDCAPNPQAVFDLFLDAVNDKIKQHTEHNETT